MTMVFTLTLSLDDDEAQEDRAEAIRAALARASYAVQDERAPTEGSVRDANGNTIGEWRIAERPLSGTEALQALVASQREPSRDGDWQMMGNRLAVQQEATTVTYKFHGLDIGFVFDRESGDLLFPYNWKSD
jgi:hypothetical protein